MNDQTVEAQKKGLNTSLMVVLLVVVVIAGLVGYQMINKKQTEEVIVETPVVPEPTNTETTTGIVESGTDNADLATYKNGTYAVIGEYKSPAGPEEIGVTIVLENAVIKDVTVEAKATNPVSVKRQEAFVGEYKAQVIGKNIDEVQLDKVGGSSLTSQGFNDALEKVKMQTQT